MQALLAIAAAIAVSASAAEPLTAPAAPRAGPSPTVSGVTVIPRPTKTCFSRDKACVALVVAELKRLYPEQLKQFCFGWATQTARTQMTYDQMQPLNPLEPPLPTAFGVNSAVKTACASDKK
jgi:hypothetical protein